MDEFTKVIDDPNAPKRLQGLTVKAVMKERKSETDPTGELAFFVDMPDDATPQELGYFKWFVGETIDKLKAGIPEFGDKLGEARYYHADKIHGSDQQQP